MKEGQDKIYYVTADTLDAARSSRTWKSSARRALRCWLLTDRSTSGCSRSCMIRGQGAGLGRQGGLDLDASPTNRKRRAAEDRRRVQVLVERVKAALGERVKDAMRVTFRLTDSAACLVSDEKRNERALQRLLKAAGQKAPESRPILELNPTHPLVARLKAGGQNWGLGADAVRPGAAARGRAAGRPGGFRPTRESPAAGCRHAVSGRRPRPPHCRGRCRQPCRDSPPVTTQASSG